MARKVKAYTDIGRRMADLGERQRLLAKVLRVSQQTVSKKLRGETAILLADLQRLGAHYKVPLTYFFEDKAAPAELAAAWERVRGGSAVLKEVVVLLSRQPDSTVGRVNELAKFIVQGAKGSKRGGSKRSRSGTPQDIIAAEEAGRYKK
jgi:transcriptional regulator with XRE-family HTH domain